MGEINAGIGMSASAARTRPWVWVTTRLLALPVALVRRVPFSLVMIGLVLLLAYRTGSIHGGLDHGIRERWGYDLDNLRQGHLWVLLSSEVLTGYPAHVHNTVWMLIAWLVPYEAIAGTGRALVSYWVGTLVGTGGAALISLLVIQTVGWDRSPDLVHGADVGASVGAWGVAGALSVWLVSRGSLWRAAGLIFPLVGLSYLDNILVARWGISDLAHPIGLATGLAASVLLTPHWDHGAPPSQTGPGPTRGRRPS